MPPFENDYLKFVKEKMDERYEQGLEQGLEQGIEQGRFESIYDGIWQIIDIRFGTISERAARTIEDVNFYPALEEIRNAIVAVPSKEDFEKELDRIVEKYREEIRERKSERASESSSSGRTDPVRP